MPDDQPCTIPELIAVLLSRHMQDGWIALVGAASYEAATACRLAQLTHAPNLTFLFGVGAVNPDLKPMPPSVADFRATRGAEGVLGFHEVSDLALAGRIDLFLAGAIQIDKYGNLNLVCTGDYARPQFRGPGSVGLPFLTCRSKNLFISTRAHNRRTFVERVDFISGVGYLDGPGGRARAGADEERGPRLVVSNLAVMDFDPETKAMRLVSVHPDVSVPTVVEKTGFKLIQPAQVPVTAMPTRDEMRLVRQEIDTEGILRRI